MSAWLDITQDLNRARRDVHGVRPEIIGHSMRRRQVVGHSQDQEPRIGTHDPAAPALAELWFHRMCWAPLVPPRFMLERPIPTGNNIPK